MPDLEIQLPTFQPVLLDSEYTSENSADGIHGHTDNLACELWWQGLGDGDLACNSGSNVSEKWPDLEDNNMDLDSDSDGLDPAVQNPNYSFFQLPDTLTDLQKQLLGDYVLPTEPPQCSSSVRSLTASETTSLQHYVAWRKSNGTLYAYKLHANVLAKASNMEILSQKNAKKLAQDLTCYEFSMTLAPLHLT